MTSILSANELKQQLLAIGAERYHDKHPFHHLMRSGKLNREQIQAWALNRYCYQCHIPLKDAALLSRVDDIEIRREWRRRLVDHDGSDASDSGIERWLCLTDGLGLDRELVTSLRAVLPATRFAVEAYVRFVRERSLLEAVASSLTELFAPTIISERVAGMLRHYDFVDATALQYFDARLTQAPMDSEFALRYVLGNARTPEQQQAALSALRFKCDVLWTQLDALHYAYVDPGHIPPGCFRPEP
ncbi:pyrroloquinoline-quinone synthase PqqC [Bradyrhizobium sp. LHD-71]|uniref:pyrroloquinoline-quinone synthase PqqC n=1 Tax=Bradyrhizobium sp. LHD-71 TaxID=3072141 RepID=UPI00280F7535|nr:pyrroloquinoline-quinone synthase PqqC [Bradyrhizobium sp. LHD-71]MDQ8727173.1 pyrroloquinoline-quinone synthase PqqC [Bradyrhizobium sp. LHD-71]